MQANLATLDDPVRFATRYVRARGWAGHRDFDELVAVAVDALVKAGLSWVDREVGVAFTTWAWRYMDREVLREVARDRRRFEGRAIPTEDLDVGRWLYRTSTDGYRRVEDRLVLDDLFARAHLSPTQVDALWLYATHGGGNGPPPRGQAPVGQTYGPTARTAVRRIRQAVTGGEHDDPWSRARAAERAGVKG